jgi:hypothetical protein
VTVIVPVHVDAVFVIAMLALRPGGGGGGGFAAEADMAAKARTTTTTLRAVIHRRIRHSLRPGLRGICGDFRVPGAAAPLRALKLCDLLAGV